MVGWNGGRRGILRLDRLRGGGGEEGEEGGGGSGEVVVLSQPPYPPNHHCPARPQWHSVALSGTRLKSLVQKNGWMKSKLNQVEKVHRKVGSEIGRQPASQPKTSFY